MIIILLLINFVLYVIFAFSILDISNYKEAKTNLSDRLVIVHYVTIIIVTSNRIIITLNIIEAS